MTRADIKSGSDLRKQENELCQTQGQEDLAFSETIEDRLDRWNRTSKLLGISPITLALAEEDVIDKIEHPGSFEAERLFIDCIREDIYVFVEQEKQKAKENAMKARCML